VFIGLGFVILLLPSGLIALGGYRYAVLAAYALLLLAGLLGLPRTQDRAATRRWRYSAWFVTLGADVHRVFIGRQGPVVVGIGPLRKRASKT
jgi:hypothetical protein